MLKNTESMLKNTEGIICIIIFPQIFRPLNDSYMLESVGSYMI